MEEEGEEDGEKDEVEKEKTEPSPKAESTITTKKHWQQQHMDNTPRGHGDTNNNTTTTNNQQQHNNNKQQLHKA